MPFWKKMKVAAIMTLSFLAFNGTVVRTYIMAAAEDAKAQAEPVASTRGSIDKIDGNDLTLHVLRGHSGILRPVKLSDKTIVILPGGKPGTTGDLKPGQWIKVTFAEKVTDRQWLNAVRIEPSIAPYEEARLFKIANEEAINAYRKQHGLAADAPAPDFDHDRQPTGAVHHNRVEAEGDDWRVILISTITLNGVSKIVSHVEVPLDKTGKLAGEVKFGDDVAP